MVLVDDLSIMEKDANSTCEAPIAKEVEMTYHKEAFEVKLMVGSIYQDRPSPAVDAAWDDLGIHCE